MLSKYCQNKTCNTKNIASHAVILKAVRQYGGEVLPDVETEDGFEHRAWINTISAN